MATTPLWPFSPDQKDFNCRHEEAEGEGGTYNYIITKKKAKKKKTETAAGEMKT